MSLEPSREVLRQAGAAPAYQGSARSQAEVKEERRKGKLMKLSAHILKAILLCASSHPEAELDHLTVPFMKIGTGDYWRICSDPHAEHLH